MCEMAGTVMPDFTPQVDGSRQMDLGDALERPPLRQGAAPMYAARTLGM